VLAGAGQGMSGRDIERLWDAPFAADSTCQDV
jgi:hypothetical protein